MDREPGSTGRVLDALGAPLKRTGLLAVGLLGLGAGLFALAVPALAARLGLVRSPIWVLAAWILTAVAIGFTAIRARRFLPQVKADRLARALEQTPGWRRGAVTSLLEGAATGTSDGLFRAADDACAARVDAEGPGALAGLATRLSRRARLAGLVAALGLALLILSGPLSGTGSALW
jgi:hypothetical protein